MAPISLDPDLIARLTANGGEVPLSGPDGKPVGYFLSPEMYTAMRKAFYDQVFAEFPPEEARAVFANPKKHTTEEVWKLLDEK